MPEEKQTGIALALERVRGKAEGRFAAQQTLAEMVGVTQQTVSNWLARGYVPIDKAQAVHVATRVPLARLLKPALAAAVRVRDRSRVAA